MAEQLVKKLIAEHAVVIFSKTYCPYCVRAKELFASLGVKYHVEELDQRDDGAEIQKYLGDMTGLKTVPNVFINGKHVGGCDKCLELASSGKLKDLLNA